MRGEDRVGSHGKMKHRQSEIFLSLQMQAALGGPARHTCSAVPSNTGPRRALPTANAHLGASSPMPSRLPASVMKKLMQSSWNSGSMSPGKAASRALSVPSARTASSASRSCLSAGFLRNASNASMCTFRRAAQGPRQWRAWAFDRTACTSAALHFVPGKPHSRFPHRTQAEAADYRLEKHH